MSVSLLRQVTLKHPICRGTLRLPPRRLYTLAHASFVDHDSSGHPQPSDSAAGPSEPVDDSPKPKRTNSKDGQATPKPKKSKTKKSAGPPRKDPLEKTGTEIHLEMLETSAAELTLQDIENYRPERHTHNVDSLQYTKEYEGLVDKLTRSFSRSQLQGFTMLYGLPFYSTLKKIEYAEAIIEKQWNWPSLNEVKKQRRDRTEVKQHTYKLSPVQVFLLLGKDGSELLEISNSFNVHIALTRIPSHELGKKESEIYRLQVEGVTTSLKALSSHITAVKNSIVEDVFDLPGRKTISQDLVQPISRLANAYVDNLEGKGTVRICAKHPRNLALAKRLVVRASIETEESARISLLSYLPTGVKTSTHLPAALFPHNYSVFPFLSPRSLPWTMRTGGAFRIRKVVEWLGINGQEDVKVTGGLAGGQGRILSVEEKETDLRSSLLAGLPKSDPSGSSTTIITASFGHILLPAAKSSQRASIVPPLKGFYPIARVLKWLEMSSQETTFVPSLPTKLLGSTPKAQKFCVRLSYHVFESSDLASQKPRISSPLPTKTIKFEVILAKSGLTDTPHSVASEQAPTAAAEQPAVAHEEHESSDLLPDHGEALDGTDSKARLDQYEPRCWTGVQTMANLALPDRSMDIRFSAFNSTALSPDQQPAELQAYSSSLQSFLRGEDENEDQPVAPLPPSSITHDGETYVLYKSASVRQSIESEAGVTGASLKVVTESLLDLESQQKSSVCEVSCINGDSDEAWTAFLRNCDRLTANHYVSTNSENSGDERTGLGLDLD